MDLMRTGKRAKIYFDNENNRWVVQIDNEMKKYIFKRRKNALDCFLR